MIDKTLNVMDIVNKELQEHVTEHADVDNICEIDQIKKCNVCHEFSSTLVISFY